MSRELIDLAAYTPDELVDLPIQLEFSSEQFRYWNEFVSILAIFGEGFITSAIIGQDMIFAADLNYEIPVIKWDAEEGFQNIDALMALLMIRNTEFREKVVIPDLNDPIND